MQVESQSPSLNGFRICKISGHHPHVLILSVFLPQNDLQGHSASGPQSKSGVSGPGCA